MVDGRALDNQCLVDQLLAQYLLVLEGAYYVANIYFIVVHLSKGNNSCSLERQMTVVIRGEYYILTLTKKDIDEFRYTSTSKVSDLISEAEKDVDHFATNDMVVKTTGSS